MSRALSFGERAEEYDRWRPTYPVEAVAWLAPTPPARVVEIGAGTGRLTSLLLERGCDVDAVEPDPRMRAVLARNNPDARCRASDSTALPVPDGSADAVLVADAWHWFDPVATMEEVRRVLRPGGWLGLVWNVVAEPVEPWEHALAGPDMYDRTTKGGADGVRQRLPLASPDELEFAAFDWVWDLTPDHRAANLATTSMAIAMDPAEREAWLESARAELQGVCDAAGRDSMPIRHRASCTRWTPA
ncbi:Methyltransferase domain-containing protein [Nocardioides alpinus]|uniref:Class I SAM-dependent methyltransferase n=1 Tax=Nocardioides alpinus TaxID=748909 RepID=A0A1I1AQZ0_9ACTN|nr:class I SAM-dependent methyltransferase [Nocardioides alpinus]PKH40346.1 class I SAM-dependent methyltransferase [Nocardioides alpinus]SFB40337.1 Methyltransferase domain-containing protein [Nocardioides alpinus]